MKNLIDKVRTVNPAAAKWIEVEGKKQRFFSADAKYLVGMFIWGMTPQGHGFWKRIADAIR